MAVNEKVVLARGDVAYLYFTFTGLPVTATAQAQVGESAWADIDFSTGQPRVLLRGPDASTGAGLTVPASGPIRARITSTPEMRTIPAGYLALVQPND